VLTGHVADYCTQVLSLVPRVLGPRLGGAVQNVIKAVRAGDWTVVDGVVTAGGVVLADGEYELKLVAADVEHSAPLSGAAGVVVLDTMVTPELAAEGLARDVVRVVQQARRDADLNVSDRISLTVSASPEVTGAVQRHEAFVAAETLSTSVAYGPVSAGFTGEAGDGESVTVQVAATV
jgi:isoleucyl-tRNA synthetase